MGNVTSGEEDAANADKRVELRPAREPDEPPQSSHRQTKQPQHQFVDDDSDEDLNLSPASLHSKGKKMKTPSVLPPPDIPPPSRANQYEEDHDDEEFTEFAELLVSFHLGPFIGKFGKAGVNSIEKLLDCSHTFLTDHLEMGPSEVKRLRLALASLAPAPPEQDDETKESESQPKPEDNVVYELVSECSQGKTKLGGAEDRTEHSACELYKRSWGCMLNLPISKWLANNKTQVIAGFTTALTVVPTALAFSFLGSMSSNEGLMGAWIIMLVLAIGGGCPGMVYCNAGAVAVVLVDLAEDEGPEYVFYAFMLSGIITIFLGYIKVAKLLRLMPASVMVGFVNGLAIVIFLAQLKNFQKESEDDDGGHRRLNSFSVLEHNPDWVSGHELIYMLLNVFITIATMYAIPLTPMKAVPGALAGVVMSLVTEWALVRAAFGGKTNTVGDVAKVSASIPIPVWMNNDYDMPPLNSSTFTTVLPTALTITAVALIESLMTVRFVTSRTKIPASSDLEAIMLGVGNIVAAAFGGQGGCSEIGLTLINLNSGGVNRVSSFSAAIFTLIIMYVAAAGINAVPVSGLVGIMFFVVLHCFDFGSFKTVSASLLPKKLRERFEMGHRHKINRVDAVVIVAVTVITPFFDLAIAVIVGCLIAMCGFTWEAADRLTVEVKKDPSDKRNIKTYVVTGQIYYASIEKFISCFDVENDPKVVEVELHAGDLCDYSALQAVNGLGDEYKKVGKSLRLRKLRLKSKKMLHKGHGMLHAFRAQDSVDLRKSLDDGLHTDDFDDDAYEVAEAQGQDHLNIEGYR